MLNRFVWMLGLVLGAVITVAPVSTLRAEEKKEEPKQEEKKKEEKTEKKRKPSLLKADTVEKYTGEKLSDEVKKKIDDKREEIQKAAVEAKGEYDAFGEYKKFLGTVLTAEQLNKFANHRKEEKKEGNEAKQEKKEDKKEEKKEAKKEEKKDK